MNLLLTLLSCLPIEHDSGKFVWPNVNETYVLTIKREYSPTWRYKHYEREWERTGSVYQGDVRIYWQHFERKRNHVHCEIAESWCFTCWYADRGLPFEDDDSVKEKPFDWIVTGPADRRERITNDQP